MVFFKRGYGWILLLGLGFVLLAAATWFIHVQPAKSAAIPPRVLVQEAVNNLQPCLTCHSSTASKTELIAYRAPHLHRDEVLAADDYTIPVAADLQAKLDSQLIETGQRILGLPETNTPAYQTALSDYLQIYESSSRTNTDQVVLLGALDRLSQLEQLIKALEHQAAPYQWKPESTEQPIRVSTAVLSSVPLPTYAALYHQPLLSDVKPTEDRCWIDIAILTPVRAVFAVYRRGPPATDLFLEFV